MNQINITNRELLLNNNLLRVLPYEIGKLFHLHILGLHGNPLGKDVMSIYNEPNGTHKLLTYMLDNLSGESFLCLLSAFAFTIYGGLFNKDDNTYNNYIINMSLLRLYVSIFWVYYPRHKPRTGSWRCERR